MASDRPELLRCWRVTMPYVGSSRDPRAEWEVRDYPLVIMHLTAPQRGWHVFRSVLASEQLKAQAFSWLVSHDLHHTAFGSRRALLEVLTASVAADPPPRRVTASHFPLRRRGPGRHETADGRFEVVAADPRGWSVCFDGEQIDVADTLTVAQWVVDQKMRAEI